MAINFEAANMAGYNNPKIEVFKATTDIATNKVTDAPSKTELLRCLRRGSIPGIILCTTDGHNSSLLWLSTARTEANGDTIDFMNLAFTLSYAADSETPLLGVGG